MGNVAVKQMKPRLDLPPAAPSSTFFRQLVRKSSTTSSESSSLEYLDAESDVHSSPEEGAEEGRTNLEGILSRTREEVLKRKHEDAFMKAVLGFCAHMGGRMDTLDNARLYDEFCSYSASHCHPPPPSVGVA